MFKYQPSIAQKITLGYYIIGAIFLGMIILNFIGLRYMEKKIAFEEAISGFSNTVLEIRRCEKNYFYFGDESDYLENREYIARAQRLLKDNMNEFTALAEPAKIELLGNNIAHYTHLMERYYVLKKSDISESDVKGTNHRWNLEEDIRKTGQKILSVADDLLKSEQKKMQTFLSGTQRVLLILVVILSFVGIVTCKVLSKRVVKPLKSLTESMKRIGAGKLESLDIESEDSEIISLENAFNKMLNELHMRQRHLVQSEKLASLGVLLSGVAHELNNPLSNISTSSQILMEEIEETDNAYKRELLSQIEEQTDKAKVIVRSLLEFSRDKEFNKEIIPLRQLLEKTIQFVKGQIPAKVLLNLDVSDDLVIHADKQRVQQAILNLLINAIEAIKDGGDILIKARIHRLTNTVGEDEKELYDRLKYCAGMAKADNFVDIQITDTGVGILSERLPRIFDPFFTTKEAGAGLGLGLSIVHEIVEEHNGCIVVDSEIGKGTTFLIRLPLPRKTSEVHVH